MMHNKLYHFINKVRAGWLSKTEATFLKSGINK